MPEVDLFQLFVRPLQQAGFRYLVTGSVAAIFDGEPRLTLDVDVLVFLDDKDIGRLGFAPTTRKTALLSRPSSPNSCNGIYSIPGLRPPNSVTNKGHSGNMPVTMGAQTFAHDNTMECVEPVQRSQIHPPAGRKRGLAVGRPRCGRSGGRITLRRSHFRRRPIR